MKSLFSSSSRRSPVRRGRRRRRRRRPHRHEREPQIPAADGRRAASPIASARPPRPESGGRAPGPVAERSAIRLPTHPPRRDSVMSSAARFQRRTTPPSSTRKMPSPTASSTCAACSRSLAIARAAASSREPRASSAPPSAISRGRHAHRTDGHLPDEPLDDVEVIRRVQLVVAHQLDDADDPPSCLTGTIIAARRRRP